MRFLRTAAPAAALALLLAACGGGVTQVEPFAPSRLIAFGDEASAFGADGRKYSVNALVSGSTTSIDCETHPIWIQAVASAYSFKFAECPAGTADAKAVTRAAPGATVADMTAQINVQAAAGFTDKDLVTVMVGLHDIKQIYEGRAATDTEDALANLARQRGVQAAEQVNRLVGLGAKVIVATAPDLGITPWGLAKGSAEAGLLTRLSAAFNGRLRVNILNDGRFVGLVLADELLQTAALVPAAYGLANWKDVACVTALPDCTTASSSLVPGADALTWLWADDLHFGIVAHQQLGSMAASRAQTNPF